MMSATQGPTRSDLSVARHPKHKQPISRKPERHYAQDLGSEGLSKQLLQRSAQTLGLARIVPPRR